MIAMKILVTGATGFIGKALVRALIERGDEVIVLGRSKAKIEFVFKSEKVRAWSWVDLETTHETLDVIINLAGENIVGWWSSRKKAKIVDSRIATIKRIIAFCVRQKESGGVLIRYFQANGVGIYGIRGEREFDENSMLPPDEDFLSHVGRQIEAAAMEGEKQGVVPMLMRFGVVLDPNGGLLEQLFPLFKYGFGMVFGSGQQYMSWITRIDLVRVILFLIDHPELEGPVNVVSKEPVTQQHFARAYGKFLNRRVIFRFPAFLIKAIFGEMGTTLFLGSQRVLPQKLIDSEFEFEYPNLTYYFSKP